MRAMSMGAAIRCAYDLPRSSDHAIILSPGLSQSIAIANLLKWNNPHLEVLGYRLGTERDPLRPPFTRYVTAEEGELPCRAGSAIMTGSTATERVLKYRETVRLGQITFERRNLFFYDKIRTLDHAKQLDIPVPLTWHSVDEIPRSTGPLFYKPAREGTGGLRRRVSSREHLPARTRNGGYIFQ